MTILSPVGFVDTAPGTFHSFGKVTARTAARALKRAFEIGVSAGLVLLALPALPAITLVVWMMDERRIFSGRKRFVRAERLPLDEVILFSERLGQCSQARAPEDDATWQTSPTYDALMSGIERSLEELVAVDPDCLQNLRMFYLRAVRRPQIADERASSHRIVEMIDNAFLEAKRTRSTTAGGSRSWVAFPFRVRG